MIILRKPKTQPGVILLGEKPSGDINGVNQVYTTAYNYRPGKIQVFYNGQALHGPDDFTETGYNEFELTYLFPDNTDELRVTYEVDGCIGPVPSNCITQDDLYFTTLNDTPDGYTGHAGEIVTVKEDETGLEFTASSGIDFQTTFLKLLDTPITYSGSENQFVKVNSTATGLEFTTASGIIDEKYGVKDIPNGVDSISVVFSSNFLDADYTLITDLENTVDSNRSEYGMVVSTKVSSGFTVVFSGDIDSLNYKLNWLAKRH